MNRSEIVEHIRLAIADVLEREIPELPQDARLFEDLAMNSTMVVELLMALEDTADLRIDPDQMQPEVLHSVASLADFLSVQQAGSAA